MSMRALVFVTLVGVGAGCGTSTRTTLVNPAPHAMHPRSPASVELFTSGPPARPHADIAIIEAEESSSFNLADTSDMLAALRERGARMGCDGVVLGGSSSRDPGLKDTETWLVENPKGRKGFYGTCIVYTDRAPATASR
jgi:hypothetical protein